MGGGGHGAPLPFFSGFVGGVLPLVFFFGLDTDPPAFPFLEQRTAPAPSVGCLGAAAATVAVAEATGATWLPHGWPRSGGGDGRGRGLPVITAGPCHDGAGRMRSLIRWRATDVAPWDGGRSDVGCDGAGCWDTRLLRRTVRTHREPTPLHVSGSMGRGRRMRDGVRGGVRGGAH